MPIPIHISAMDLFDSKTNQFISVKETNLQFEHSLLSISKWEAKWHKPYLSTEKKTQEEYIDYLRCMCLTQNYDPNVFYAIDTKSALEIADYIKNPMTATTIKRKDKKSSKEIITNEIIYYWMTQLGIPFDPCQKWHLNRLMTLIEVASIKSQPPKKMGKREAAQQRAALNAQRKARYHTHG